MGHWPGDLGKFAQASGCNIQPWLWQYNTHSREGLNEIDPKVDIFNRAWQKARLYKILAKYEHSITTVAPLMKEEDELHMPRISLCEQTAKKLCPISLVCSRHVLP